MIIYMYATSLTLPLAFLSQHIATDSNHAHTVPPSHDKRRRPKGERQKNKTREGTIKVLTGTPGSAVRQSAVAPLINPSRPHLPATLLYPQRPRRSLQSLILFPLRTQFSEASDQPSRSYFWTESPALPLRSRCRRGVHQQTDAAPLPRCGVALHRRHRLSQHPREVWQR